MVAGRDALRQALLAMVPQIDELQKKRELMKHAHGGAHSRVSPGAAAGSSSAGGGAGGGGGGPSGGDGGLDSLPPLMGGHGSGGEGSGAAAVKIESKPVVLPKVPEGACWTVRSLLSPLA